MNASRSWPCHGKETEGRGLPYGFPKSWMSWFSALGERRRHYGDGACARARKQHSVAALYPRLLETLRDVSIFPNADKQRGRQCENGEIEKTCIEHGFIPVLNGSERLTMAIRRKVSDHSPMRRIRKQLERSKARCFPSLRRPVRNPLHAVAHARAPGRFAEGEKPPERNRCKRTRKSTASSPRPKKHLLPVYEVSPTGQSNCRSTTATALVALATNPS